MWIKVLQRRWRYGYYDVVREVVVKHNLTETRTRRVWKSEPRWVEVEIWVGKRKYQKRPHHSKKSLSEKDIAKKAWREHKQTERDKAKRQDFHGYHSDGCPTWMKRFCNKTHRQWEKRCIHHGKYDKLGSWNHKRKDIFDPWMWD